MSNLPSAGITGFSTGRNSLQAGPVGFSLPPEQLTAGSIGFLSEEYCLIFYLDSTGAPSLLLIAY